MWEFVLPAVASLASGLLGKEGQEDANQANRDIAQQNSAFNAEQAQTNRDFQERMSGTAYQRATKDMMAAGLNPMLAYSQGGASSPSGATGQAVQPAPMQNTTAAGITAAQSTIQSLNTAAQTRNVDSQTKVNEVEARLKEQEIFRTIASSGHLDAVKDNIRQEMQSFEKRMEKLKYETFYEKGRQELPYYDIAKGERERQRDYPHQEADVQRAKELKNRAEILGLDIPRAINDAAFERGDAGKARPYVEFGTGNLGKLTGSAASASRAFRNFK